MDELRKKTGAIIADTLGTTPVILALGVRQIRRSYFCKFVFQTLLYTPQITSLL